VAAMAFLTHDIYRIFGCVGKWGKSQIAISTVRTTSENDRESENMNELILIKPWFWVKPFGDNPLTQLQPYSIGFQALSELQARDVDFIQATKNRTELEQVIQVLGTALKHQVSVFP
jgi:hypothetical protein